MLTLTPVAAQAVRSLVADTEVDDRTGGLRIAPGEPTPDGPGLALALVGGPQATDQTVESDGAQVYVDPTVAELLSGKLLDASVDGGQVRFALFDRRDESGASPPT